MSIANPVDHRAIRVAIRIRYHFWPLRASLISAPLAARLPMSLAKTKTATRNSGRTDRANSRPSEWINSISMHTETADRMRLKFHQTNQTSRLSPLFSHCSAIPDKDLKSGIVPLGVLSPVIRKEFSLDPETPSHGNPPNQFQSSGKYSISYFLLLVRWRHSPSGSH